MCISANDLRDFIVGQRGRRMIVKTIAASQIELDAEVVVWIKLSEECIEIV